MTLAAKLKEVLALVARVEALYGMSGPEAEEEWYSANCEAEQAAYDLVRSPDFAGLVDEVEKLREDYLRTCRLVAEMHGAAVGKLGEGPKRGVVEDVLDVRLRAEAAEAEAYGLKLRAQDDAIERDDLSAKLAAAELNDARYRWLAGKFTQKTAYDIFGDGGLWQCGINSKDSRLTLDAAIDAAMRGG